MSTPYGQNLSYPNYSVNYPYLFYPAFSTPATIYPTAPPLDQMTSSLLSSPKYSQIISIISIPSDVEKSVNQAYIDMIPTLQIIYPLPPLNLDMTSICILKEIEQQAKKGMISDCLFVIIKILDVIRQLGIGFTVSTSVALILCAIWGFPIIGTILSSLVVIPLINLALLGSLACKVTACGLNCLRNEWMNDSFRLMIKEHKSLMLDLKRWIQIKELSQIEKNIQDLLRQLSNIQFSTVQLYQENQEKIREMNYFLQKIHAFQVIEKNLNMQKSMPILDQYLNHLKVT